MQVVRELKHKLRPENAYFKAKEFEFVLSAPKEELHQFLFGLYGNHLLPATMYEIEKALRVPETIRGYDKNGAAMYTISESKKNRFGRDYVIVWRHWIPAQVLWRLQMIMLHTFTTCTSDSMMKST